MATYPQLEEQSFGRAPDIWVVCADIQGDQLVFELAYLNSSYGGSEAVLAPVGGDSPRIRIQIPEIIVNLPSSTILVKPSSFTILEIND